MKLFKLLQKMKSIRVFLWTLSSFAVAIVLSVIAQVHSEDESSTPVTVQVTRRFLQDVYFTILQPNDTHVTSTFCEANNATYLVNESQCINNNHLFNGNLKCMMNIY